jgi:predicted MFS family arabinose efflux permease
MGLSPTVRRLGLVSLLTDASSEMIYPLLPAFVTGVLHAGPAFLGLVEGIAEAVASLLKIASGVLSDRVPQRKRLVFGGYLLSSLARPLMALASAPLHVLVVRFCDRVGKGVRSAPRDALIAEAVDARDRGRAYGFHRAMDNAGAVVGPLLASVALGVGLPLRFVFALAVVPGIASLLVLGFGVHEAAPAEAQPQLEPEPASEPAAPVSETRSSRRPSRRRRGRGGRGRTTRPQAAEPAAAAPDTS